MIGILIFIVFGAASGILAGLLGIGGGVIAVPVFYFTLAFYGFPRDTLMEVAVATSLASTVITSFGASWSHHQKKVIRFDTLKPILIGLCFGCTLGVFLANYLSSSLLRVIFGSALLSLSLYFFFPRIPSPYFAPRPNRSLSLWSVLIGALSTLLGIGGGIFFVPILLGYQLPMKNAIATSSACTLISAFLASGLFLLLSNFESSLPFTFGSIYIPGFVILGLSSLTMTPFGAKLAHTLPVSVIKRIFAVALAVTGSLMLFVA